MKSRVLKFSIAAFFAVLLFMNAGVVLKAKSNSNRSLIAANAAFLVDSTGSSSSSSSSSGAPNSKECGLDECSKTWVYGVAPYQVTVTRNGHYKHCKLTMDTGKNCVSSTCDMPCDATED